MFVQSNDGLMTLAPGSVIDPAAVAVTVENPNLAYNRILSRGGALPWARDPVDSRIVNQVKTATGTVILSQNDVGGWPVIPTINRAANWDTDFDGMPDWWELDRSSNRLVADNNVVAANGYTQLENYLNAVCNTSNWGVDADGNWSNDANWLGGAPNGVDALAGFASGITSPRTITVNAPQTVGILQLDSAVAYTLVGGGANQITLDDSAGRAAINVLSGSHTIAAALNLADDMAIVVLPAGSTLNITGAINANGHAIIKDGAGAVQVPNVRAAALSVNAGTVTVAADGTNAGASKFGSLNIGTGATLDLNDNSMIVGPATPQATLQAQIINARHGGAWDQSGITSSAARTQVNHATTLGLLSGAEYTSVGGTGTFVGQSYDAADSLIKYTWYGDSDFNGRVNFDDYVRIDNGFNNHLTGWLNGDFDLNGTINFDDYVLIDLAFNTQTGTLGRALSFLDGSNGTADGMSDPSLREVQEHFAQFGESYARAFLASVPEPASLGFAGIATSVAMLSRRRHGRAS
jgi:hypothetical protein